MSYALNNPNTLIGVIAFTVVLLGFYYSSGRKMDIAPWRFSH
ncbi:MAG TPA: hypothetical protein VN860_04650 [Candidatus Acidoferrales bacterium]|nr:hypothetical protein [Candidatus Acidoferrales bacterium]